MHLDGTVLLGTGPWGSPSIYFDGNSRNVQTPFALSVAERFAVMDRDFTMECWFWLAGDSPLLPANNIRDGTLMTTWPNGGAASGLLVYIIGNANTTGDGIACSISDTNGNAEYCTYWGAITKNAWHHVAFSRTGGNLYLHYDGVMVITTPASKVVATPATPPYAGPLLLGMTAYPGWAMAFNGYIDDFRFTIGKGRYGNANFALQNAPFPNGVAAYTDVYNRVFSDSVTMSEASNIILPSTWDPALVGSNFTLSGDKLSATKATLGFCSPRSTSGRTSGKLYIEAVYAGASAGDVGIGVCRSTYPLTGAYIGNTAPSVGVRNNGFGGSDGVYWANPSSDLNVGNGVWMFMAVDVTNSLVWLKKQGGTMWNNNASADPATGVGGISLSGSGPIYVAGTAYTSPDVVTINFGGSAFVGAVPSGFSPWG
jgi:hypothetical protein